MKKIIYSKNNNLLYIAHKGEFRGVKFFIVAGGIHPCAYVMCDEQFITKHKDDWGGLDCISVHGGVTWTENVSKLLKHPDDCTGTCFGWDYGHAGDWSGYMSDVYNLGFKKWDTFEIIDECLNAINQYLEIKMKDDEEEETNQDEHPLSKEILDCLGFDNTNADGLYRKCDKEWAIQIDLQNQLFSYAKNYNSDNWYSGDIRTLEDLKMVTKLCKIPIEV